MTNKNKLVIGSVIVLVLSLALAEIFVLTTKDRPRNVYDRNKSLAAEAKNDAKNYSWPAYEVSRFANDEITLDRALISTRWQYSIIPLTPCTEEQANLEIGDIVQFEHVDQSLDPNEPNSFNLLCYMKIKR